MKLKTRRLIAVFPVMLLFAALSAVTAFAGTPMSDFDYARYGSENPELLRAYGPEIMRGELYLHYIQYGAAEGRKAYSIKTAEPFVLDDGEAQNYEYQQTLTTAQSRLSNAPLAPERDFPAELLDCAENVVTNVSGSTPYEKLLSCYDWVINNTEYGYASSTLRNADNMSERAYQVFSQHIGVCDDYASAFAVMARIIGFDARLQSGQTTTKSGGYTGHTWCVINIHGVDYVFDPQVEDNISKGGAINHLRFCKTYQELPGKYIRYADDVVCDEVMNSASNEPLPLYFFGEAREYFNAVNAARAEAGVAPLEWDEQLATAAYRQANGISYSKAFAGLGNVEWATMSYSQGSITSPSAKMNLDSSLTHIGAYLLGADFALYLR